MSASQQFLPQDSSTLANFIAWGSAISSFLNTIGWSKTSDTGQVNWGTIASVPTAGTYVYEIWQPGDALQTGSTAYYLKIQYGQTSRSPSAPDLIFQIGTGTNGSGTLTGFTLPAMEPSAANGYSGGATLTYECDFSGDSGRLGMLLWRNAPSGGGFTPVLPYVIVIERTLNTTGSPASDGVTIAGFNSGDELWQQTLVFGGPGAAPGTGGSNNADYVALTDNNSSGVFNNNIPMSPMFPVYGKYGNPMTVAGFVHAADVGEGCEFSTTLYGSTRTYIVTHRVTVSNPGNSVLAMRFD